jgi:nucleoside-diphosphate-sugar epimerase
MFYVCISCVHILLFLAGLFSILLADTLQLPRRRPPNPEPNPRKRGVCAAQILGEKLVLAADGRGGLCTAALRPSGIFGEHDPLLVPLTVANARKGKMKYIIGSGKNLMDFTYVGNVAQAHLLVSALLAPTTSLQWMQYLLSN